MSDTAASRFIFITLGCAKNEVDTDRMSTLLVRNGYLEADDISAADVILVNTCSFLLSATQESITTTLEVLEQVTQQNINAPVIMCGCVPSRYGTEIADELPEVAAFVGADKEDDIVAIVDDVLHKEKRSFSDEMYIAARTARSASAYVKISDGCDRFCAFCAIPYIRGRYASRTFEDIAQDIKELLAQGVKEIVLVGQDTGIWGSDFEDTSAQTPKNLAQLLVALADIVRPYDAWLRVLYLQPEGMTDELISAIRDTKEVLPYIDIPVQHCNAEVLQTMNRTGNSHEFHELFARLRKEIPGMVLRSTAMAGFPGETQEAFDELCDFLQDESFDYCSVFAYSPEEPTAASRMEQIADEVKQERTQILQDLADQNGFANTAAHVGQTAEVIIDGIEELEDGTQELIGHAWFQAPDSDGAVHIAQGDVCVGDKVNVKFIDSFCYELEGVIVDD